MLYVTHSVRLPEDLLKVLKLRSRVMHRSFNQEVIYLLRKALDDTAYYDEQALRILRTHQGPITPSGSTGV